MLKTGFLQIHTVPTGIVDAGLIGKPALKPKMYRSRLPSSTSSNLFFLAAVTSFSSLMRKSKVVMKNGDHIRYRLTAKKKVARFAIHNSARKQYFYDPMSSGMKTVEAELPHKAFLVYEIFLGGLAILVLILNTVEWLIPANLTGRMGRMNDLLVTIIFEADILVCSLYFVDFILRHVAPIFYRFRKLKRLTTLQRFRKVSVTLLDCASCIPQHLLGTFGDAWRVFRLLQIVRMLKAAEILGDFLQETRGTSVVLFTAFISFTSWLFGALAVLAFEFDAKLGTIKTPADALWWSAATITTVGYGDVAPVTAAGRTIAFMLMLVGVSIFGVASGLIATVAIHVISPKTNTEAPDPAIAGPAAASSTSVQGLRSEISLLRQDIAQMQQSIKTLSTSLSRYIP